MKKVAKIALIASAYAMVLSIYPVSCVVKQMEETKNERHRQETRAREEQAAKDYVLNNPLHSAKDKANGCDEIILNYKNRGVWINPRRDAMLRKIEKVKCKSYYQDFLHDALSAPAPLHHNAIEFLLRIDRNRTMEIWVKSIHDDQRYLSDIVGMILHDGVRPVGKNKEEVERALYAHIKKHTYETLLGDCAFNPNYAIALKKLDPMLIQDFIDHYNYNRYETFRERCINGLDALVKQY